MTADGRTVAGSRHWGVVGGGLLGLTLALRLAQAGQRVTLLEAAPDLGGLASAWRLGGGGEGGDGSGAGVTWDRHYHVTLLSDRHLRGLLAELGLDSEMHWSVTRTGFYADGRLHPLDNALDYLRLPVLGPIDKLRLAATIWGAARIADGRPLEKVPLADWLIRYSGRRTYERIWLPLLRAKLGENHARASAAFIWAVIRRLYAARRSGLKTEMFGYVPGGYARILKRFAEVLAAHGVTVECGQQVSRITRDAGGLCVMTAEGGRRFDRVAVTLPAPLAALVCDGLSAEERARLDGIVYQGIVCASVLLDRPLGPNYLTYITDPAVPFTAVVEMSALVDPGQLGGHGLVYLPKYLAADDPFFAVPDVEIEARFLDGLAAMMPAFRRERVRAFRVSRVRQVLAISTLDYSARLPPMITSMAGLAIVNSAHIVNGTLNVDETVALAERAVPALLAMPDGAGAGRAAA